MKARPATLVVGDVFSRAMEPVRIAIEKLVEEGADTRFLRTLPAACTPLFPDSWFPELVIICQHWSDEFTESEACRLIGAFPLARLVCCYGLWCESDGRSRDIWPQAVRVPVRAAPDRIQRELEVVAGVRKPLPLTASRDEIFLFDADGPIVDRLAYP